MINIQTYKTAFEYLKKKGKIRNQQHLADLLGVNKATLSQVLNEIIPPTKQFVYRFERQFPEFNAKWLEKAEGEMLADMPISVPNELKVESNIHPGVPYYEDLDITASFVTTFSDYKEIPTFMIDYKHFNDCDAYLPVVGDSMIPKYCSGDIIAVRRINNIDTLLWGETYLIITNDNANSLRTIKDVHYCKDESKLILRACNPDYAGDIVVNKTDIISMYIVKGKIKRNLM